MSDYEGASATGGPSQRIGDVERQAVIAALDTHREAGRLRSDEYEDRQVKAAQARTWADVQPLFTDLPQPHPAGMPQPSTQPGAPIATTDHPTAVAGGGPIGPASGRPRYGGLIPVPEPYRNTVMALTPFAALLLFFTTGLWVWFLAIPVMGILLYGAEGNDERKRLERRRRDDHRGR